MGDNSWKASDFASVSKGATRTAQRLFGLAGSLGKQGMEARDTSLLEGAAHSVLSLSAHSPSSSWGPLKRVRKWQAGRVEAWAFCLLGLWEGSQWFAKNSPKSWFWPPGGQHCLSLAPEQGTWRQAFHVSCGQCGLGMGLGAGRELQGAAGAWQQLALPLCPGLCLGLGEEEVSE